MSDEEIINETYDSEFENLNAIELLSSNEA